MMRTSRQVGMNVLVASVLRVAAVLLVCLPSASAQERAKEARSLAEFDDSIEALVRTVNPSVVQVFTTALAPLSGVVTNQTDLITTQRGSGSGVIVDPEGYIVTNAHVVRGASRIRVEIPTDTGGKSLLARRSRVVPARVIGVDEETDIAVLRVEERGLAALPFGDSDELRSGQMV
ncbi:MAG TPA: trypsin-like peptidase domain-containing protein, partial [Vicinamibacterales bacterium]|nr:trypsin-like peptidase domain-containing protein [Vicinamibacterales bacterium]